MTRGTRRQGLLGRLFWYYAANVVALFVAAHVVGDVESEGLASLAVAAAVFGLVNAVVKPIVKVLALPVVILTLGLALLVVNVLLFWLTAALAPGFDVDGLRSVVAGAVIVWIVQLALHLLPGPWRPTSES
jgi:putative membrane protein